MFSAVAVVTLGLGIGANVAMFSIVNAAILSPLPYHEPGSLAVIFATTERGASDAPHPPATYLEYQTQAKSFEHIAAAEAWGPTLAGDHPPEKITGLRVTPNLFNLLGVQPVMGRPLQAGDAAEGAARAMVVTNAFAQRYGGPGALLGKSLRLDGVSHSVVGVMPEEFAFPTFWVHGAQVFTALQWSASQRENRQMSTLRLFGRLREGANAEAATAEVQGIAARLAEAHPQSNRGVSARVVPLDIATGGVVRPTVLALFAAVGLLLLIACANLAGLLISRAAERQQEIAVRKALGASVSRLGGVLMSESLLLLAASSILGIAFAAWGLSLVAAQIPAGARDAIYGARWIRIDSLVLAFTIVLGGFAAIFFAGLPAWMAARHATAESLRHRGSGGDRHMGRLRTGLVVAQSAFAFALVVLSGLLFTSFRNLASAEAGFEAERLLSFVAPVSGTSQAEHGRKAIFYAQLVEHLAALPGIESASAVSHVPLLGDEWGTSFLVEGAPAPAPGEVPRAVYRTMMPGYLATIGARLRAGREFTGSDHAGATPVVVINETLARRSWPGQSAVGKRLRLGGPDSHEPWREVIGVVDDIQQQRWGTAAQEEVMLAFAQDPLFRDSPRAPFAMTVVVRTSTNHPQTLAPAIRDAVLQIAPDVPVAQLKTLNEGLAEAFWRPRLAASVGLSLAVLAALLAALGIYGALSQLVSRQQRAIGIRMALGESPGHVLRSLLWKGVVLAASGALLGLPFAFAGGRLAQSLLVDVKPADPATFAAGLATLAALGLAATLLPARRAAAIQPVEALRGD